MTRAVVDGFFVIGSVGLRPSAERIVYADGSAGPEFREGTDLELSHWVPNTTPSRWAADTSTEICLRFAADPPRERYRLAINNHVDVDGVLSLFALALSPLALEHRAVFVGAAEMGDFCAGVERASFRLAHELTLLIAESRTRQVGRSGDVWTGVRDRPRSAHRRSSRARGRGLGVGDPRAGPRADRRG